MSSTQRSLPTYLLRLTAVAALALPGAAFSANAVSHSVVHAATPAPLSTSARAATIHALVRSPLHFERNVGQAASGVQFLARGAGYGIFLRGDGATLVLQQGQRSAARLLPHAARPRPSVLQMHLLGANAGAHAAGLGRLSGVANYLKGRTASAWHRGVATYAQARFTGVYPGVDLLYYGTGSQLEYDFIVAAGADASRIALRFDGAQHVGLDRQGNLSVRLGHATLTQKAPVVYQQSAHGRVAVSGRFVVQGSTVRFALGAYNRHQSLVIDPTLAYSTFLGGTSDDFGLGLAIDVAGNAYITGQTVSADFPITPTGVLQPALAGGTDAFVSKLTPAGTGTADLIYSTYLGGTGDDTGFGIAVDSAGNAYVAGQSFSADFPTVNGLPATATLNAAVNGDAFVSKLNPTGTALLYSTLLGGSGDDDASSIALDSTGNVYITGSTDSLTIFGLAPNSRSAAAKPLQVTTSDFPTTPGAYQTVSSGETVFVSKLNPAATGAASLVYSTFIGGVNGTSDTSSDGNAIVVDSAGDAYFTGAAKDPLFPVTAGAAQPTFASGCVELNTCGGSDAFVTELNPTGTALVFSTFLGGSESDEGNGIARDSAGSIYVTGETESHDFPTTFGAFQRVNRSPTGTGGSDPSTSTAFVTKLNSTGTKWLYSTYLGGTSGEDYGWGIAVDGTGAAYVAGDTLSTNFPVTRNALFPTNRGGFDAFVTKLAPSGRSLIFSTYLGGSMNDGNVGVGDFGTAVPIKVDATGRVYVVPSTLSTDYPTTPGAYSTALNTTGTPGFADAALSVLGVSGCSVQIQLQTGNSRLSAVNSFSSSPSPTISFLSFQSGTSGFTAVFPTFTCVVGSDLPLGTGTPASVTVTGTVQSLIGKGPGFKVGDSVTAVISPSLSGGAVAVTVTDTTNGKTYTLVLNPNWGPQNSFFATF